MFWTPVKLGGDSEDSDDDREKHDETRDVRWGTGVISDGDGIGTRATGARIHGGIGGKLGLLRKVGHGSRGLEVMRMGEQWLVGVVVGGRWLAEDV